MKKITLLLLAVVLFSCGEDKADQPAVNPGDTAATTTTPAPIPDSSSTKTDTTAAGGALADYICPPCGCKYDDSLFTKAGVCPACHMDLAPKKAKS